MFSSDENSNVMIKKVTYSVCFFQIHWTTLRLFESPDFVLAEIIWPKRGHFLPDRVGESLFKEEVLKGAYLSARLFSFASHVAIASFRASLIAYLSVTQLLAFSIMTTGLLAFVSGGAILLAVALAILVAVVGNCAVLLTVAVGAVLISLLSADHHPLCSSKL